MTWLFKLVFCLETNASDSTEWKKPGEEQPHLPGPWQLPIGPRYTGAEKHKEKTSKIKMHRVDSARNGVWVIMEGLVRNRPTRNKRNNSKEKKIKPWFIINVMYRKSSWRLSHLDLIFTNYYITAIICWALTMCWLIAKHFI